MAVDPDSLTVPPYPMPWLPDVIRAAYVITRAANVVRPVANLDRDGARITPIIGSAVIRSTIIRSTIIRPIARVGAISPFTPPCTEGGANQSKSEN